MILQTTLSHNVVNTSSKIAILSRQKKPWKRPAVSVNITYRVNKS